MSLTYFFCLLSLPQKKYYFPMCYYKNINYKVFFITIKFNYNSLNNPRSDR